MKKRTPIKKGPLGTPLGNPVGYFNNSRSALKKAQEGTETKKITSSSDWAKQAQKSGKSWYSMTDQQRKDYKINYAAEQEAKQKKEKQAKFKEFLNAVSPGPPVTAPGNIYAIGKSPEVRPAMLSHIPDYKQKYKLEKYKKVKTSNTTGIKPTTYSFSDTESESSASSRKPYKTKEISAKRYNRLSNRYAKQSGSTIKKDSDIITYGNAKGTRNVSAMYKKGGSIKSKKK
jgi:hypothetical protein